VRFEESLLEDSTILQLSESPGMKKTIIAVAVIAGMLQGPLMWGQQSAPRQTRRVLHPRAHIRELEDRVIALEGKNARWKARRLYRPHRHPKRFYDVHRSGESY